MKKRLDQLLVFRKLVASRSQAQNYIELGVVKVDGRVVTKAGFLVSEEDSIQLITEQYVSRAGLKLASVAKILNLDFKDKTVLDVGSSTGGFTDYALKHGAKKVIAVDVGTDQMHPKIATDDRVELHEKTDIRDFVTDQVIDLVVMDVSFISSRLILPHLHKLVSKNSMLAIMVKPQFEAGKDQINKGVVKNNTVRRQILKAFESWTSNKFTILDKADSEVAGQKGNVERFYLLKKL